MKFSDIPLPDSVENELKDALYELRLILNNGKYQLAKYAVAPTASTSGQEGEVRWVIEGVDARLYIHDGTSWWKSPYTYTKIT